MIPRFRIASTGASIGLGETTDFWFTANMQKQGGFPKTGPFTPRLVSCPFFSILLSLNNESCLTNCLAA